MDLGALELSAVASRRQAWWRQRVVLRGRRGAADKATGGNDTLPSSFDSTFKDDDAAASMAAFASLAMATRSLSDSTLTGLAVEASGGGGGAPAAGLRSARLTTHAYGRHT